MDVRLLGQIEAIDGEPLPLAGPTQRRVLAALALRRNEVVSVGHLVDVIWPDLDPPDRAEHNVRTYVHRLRSSLNGSDDRIETVGAGYRLSLAADELDAARFEQLAQAATRLAGMGESVETLDAVEEAEELWQGNPLEEFEHEAWARPDVVRLLEIHVQLGTQRAETLIELGRPADAVASLEALVRDEALRERPRALLMRALYESGRQAEALRAFQEFRRLLVDEVGVEPSPGLVELDRAIATGELRPSREQRRTVGNYELVERIGEGAFAVVHRARQESLGRYVALKVVRAELANRPEFIRRFEAEAQMVAAIEHPNVVPLYDYWREPDGAFLVMRWMAGGSLETRLDAGPWALDDAVELVDQIAAALTASHEHGVVHRDVKPANILFDESGRAYLGDFGIALSADERATPQAALSEGSPVFASPEQLRREPVGPEADVHALAIVAFTVLTGRTPFADSPDDAALLRRQLDEPIPPISTMVPGLPVVLDAVLATATAKLPVERYASASEFAAAFRAAASGDVAIQPERPLGEQRINPYLGLRAFSETDADAFYGRDRLTEELVSRLATPDQNMIAVVGPSGSGKSSVVRAGLIPALRRGRVPGSEQWFTTTMIPGSHPFESLETALLRVAINPPGTLIDQLRDGDRGILRGIKRIVPDDGVVVVVIDQFEEVFTNEGPETERAQFLRALAVAVTEPASPVRVVLTLRADFYDEPLRNSEFAPLMKRHTVVVTPLAPDELEEAITRPAAEVGVGFEPGLVAEMAADVNRQPGALPLLQFALTQAFDVSEGPTIAVDDYRAVGGLSGALARRADDAWRELPADAQVAARRLFGRLVALGEGTEDTRRRVDRSELPADDATDEAIGRFGRARLLTFDHNPATREPTIEIAHEALIREWQRLRGWLDDDRDTLRVHHHVTAAAAGWADRDRDANELYRGARLDVAAPLLTTDAIALNDAEADFLRASVQRRDDEAAEEQRRLRRLHRLVAVTAVVAAVALLAGALALVQWRRADDQAADAATNAELAAGSARDADDRAAEAEQARGEAESAALIADEERARADENAGLADERATEAEVARRQADLERLRAVALATAPERPNVAALLAVEAHRIDPSVDSLDVLHRTLTAVRGVQGFVPIDGYTELELLADATTMVAVGRTLDVWDVERRELIRSAPLPPQSVLPILDVSLDGRTAVVRTGSTEVAVLDIQTGDVSGTLTNGSDINDVALSRDGALVALAQSDGLVTLWDAVTFERRADLDSGEGSVSLVDWSPTENDVALVTSVSTTQVWAAATGEQRWSVTPAIELVALNAVPTGIVHSSDGSLVVVESGSLSPVLHTYSTSDGSQPFAPTARADGATGINALMWVDEARLHLGAGSSTSVAVYDLTTGGEVGGRVGDVVMTDAVYSPRLREVVGIGSRRLHFRSIDGTGPLERVALLSDEQHAAVTERGGTVHPAIAADGSRLIVSVLGGDQVGPTTSFDLNDDDPMAPGDFPFVDRTAFGNGPFTMTFGLAPFQLELLDELDEPVATVPLTTPDVIDQDASADGRFIVVARTGGLIDLYDGSGAFLRTLDMELPPSEPGSIVIPSLTDDGRYVAANTGLRGGWANAVWSTDTYERVDDGTIGGQSRLAGDLLAQRSGNEVQLHALPSFETVGPPMINEPGGMFYPAADPVNGRLAVTSQETVTVYDIASGKQLGRALPYQPIRIEFTEDGTQLAVASDDRVTVWNYDTDAWPDLACEVVGRNLTREEWDQFGPRTVDYRATCEQYELPG